MMICTIEFREAGGKWHPFAIVRTPPANALFGAAGAVFWAYAKFPVLADYEVRAI